MSTQAELAPLLNPTIGCSTPSGRLMHTHTVMGSAYQGAEREIRASLLPVEQEAGVAGGQPGPIRVRRPQVVCAPGMCNPELPPSAAKAVSIFCRRLLKQTRAACRSATGGVSTAAS
jgi:hypothetical protein